MNMKDDENKNLRKFVDVTIGQDLPLNQAVGSYVDMVMTADCKESSIESLAVYRINHTLFSEFKTLVGAWQRACGCELTGKYPDAGYNDFIKRVSALGYLEARKD